MDGIEAGHAHNLEALTGVTVVLCREGAVGGADMRGTATGAREINPLDPTHLVSRVHGICLAGGSAFGLDAAGGVMKWLEEHGVGFPVGPTLVPIVPSAIIFDLNCGDYKVRPDADMGMKACENATDSEVEEGCVGVGAGATIGKLRGKQGAMKTGVGSYGIVTGDGLQMGAIAVVNAFGDVKGPDGRIIAGCRTEEGGFLDTEKALAGPLPEAGFGGTNTTLVIVATNAELTKSDAKKVSQMAQVGMARTISPCHTTVDGDVVFTMATCKLGESVPLNRLGVMAAEVTSRAIIRSVITAESMEGLPSYKSLDASSSG